MLTLRIISPEKILYEGDASLVKVPGVSGEFEILDNHAPIISALQSGTVEVEGNGKRRAFTIMGGFVEVHKNMVDLCVEME